MTLDTTNSSLFSLDIAETRFQHPSVFATRARMAFAGKLTDFCVPANPYFPPSELMGMLKANLPDIVKHYPDHAPVYQQCVAELVGTPSGNIVVANGITELITLLCRDSRGPILTTVPTFGRWTELPRDFDIPVYFIERTRARDFQLTADEVIARARATGAATVVICNPNNPTGAWFSAEDIAKLVRELAHLQRLIIDESFIEYSGLESAEALACVSANTVVVKSMGNSLGWHGLRLGYAVANEAAAHALRAMVPYWNINGVAGFVLKHIGRFRSAYTESFRKVARDRQHMLRALQTVPGLTTWPSKGNYLYCELPRGVSGKQLCCTLLERYGLLVRACGSNPGSSERYLRFVVRPRDEANKLVNALADVLGTALDGSGQAEAPRHEYQ